ncbi:L-threonine 3-dehydrogenase [Ruminiclostridium cellobioparum subsp. termitidis CT1112]|uniref:L-threonine 3-dehydrogenase n=2 Tax=Ruminiclostridium cellobioparum TaxID=29355 RepID=S0FKD2_RUMCE|nr:L-threonine 3-dehydrogenase [Ruminiclostridium cellobioparum]EMS72297.1 L-threonine 3-dehydrogenase [Ruminiclostridium cellobioparum subsp. termitidis CT1112]
MAEARTMKALVKKYRKPGIWMDEVPVPGIGINDVLIKINKTSICGTDIHIYNWDEWAQKTIPTPMTIGHEFVGTVAALGSNVHDFKLGDIVSGEGHIVCGLCRNCLAGRRHLCMNTSGVGVNRPGAFAEYIAIPVTNVWHSDGSVPQDIQSCFDPFGNAVHTALAFNVLGEDVLITGAGPIGIMAAAVVRHAGARHVVITDVNPYRLELAKKLGVTMAININEASIEAAMEQLGMKEGFDVGLEMSGNASAFNKMVDLMCHGGKIALLGIQNSSTQIDWEKVVFNGLTIKGIYGREMYETWYKMTVMLQSGLDISKIITHRFNIMDFQKGFEIMASGNSGKVVLEWN